MAIHNLTIQEFSTLKILNNKGSEGIIYSDINKGYLNKIYLQPSKYNSQKLITLSEMQPYIEHTKLPLGPTHINDIFQGAHLVHHVNTTPLINLKKWQDQESTKMFLKILITNLKELTNLGIYPTDIDNENILISRRNKTVEIIDLDGEDCILSDKTNKELQKIVLILLRHTILVTILKGYRFDQYNKYGSEYLKRFAIPNDIISSITNELISYEALEELTKSY